MVENHRKSLIYHCERSELRLHFEWTKVYQKRQKWSILAIFRKAENVTFLMIFNQFLSYHKLPCLVTLFDRKPKVFKNSPNWTIFGTFNLLLSTQNVNVARFARNVECDFFSEFQTLWCCTIWFQSHDRTSQRCTRGLNDRLDLKT